MTSVLFLGLMIGMQHALEADHIAAVASIAARETTLKRAVPRCRVGPGAYADVDGGRRWGGCAGHDH